MIRCQRVEKQGGENSLTQPEAKSQAQVVSAQRTKCLFINLSGWFQIN